MPHAPGSLVFPAGRRHAIFGAAAVPAGTLCFAKEPSSEPFYTRDDHCFFSPKKDACLAFREFGE